MNQIANKRDGSFWFAGLQLPHDAALTHFAYIGATGSGKTISQRMLYQDTLRPYIGTNYGHRALMYDAKGDLHSILYGMGIKRKYIKTLNPFDKRCFAWDMAADIDDEASALELSTILIPEINENQPFFRQAARDILSGVIFSYILNTPGKWTFRDVVYPLLSQDRQLVKDVLRQSKYTEDRLQYFDHSTTAENIISTMRTVLKPYQMIAAMWHKASKADNTISLKEWVEKPNGEILLMGNSHKLKESLRRVNQVIFKRVSQLLLDQPELKKGDTHRTWIHLDEAREMGKLDGLPELLTNGRSKGICVVIGFQDIDGMREVWGKEVAQEIIGQCRSKAFFGLGSGSCAQWAAEQFSYNERFETSFNQSVSYNSQDTTVQSGQAQQIAKREVVLPILFMSIPPVNMKNGLRGYYISPYFVNVGIPTALYDGDKKHPIPGDQLFKGQLMDKLPDEINGEKINFDPRPPEDQRIEFWTDEEREMFAGEEAEPEAESEEDNEPDLAIIRYLGEVS